MAAPVPAADDDLLDRPIGGDWGGALSDLVRVPFGTHMPVRIPERITATVAPWDRAIEALGDHRLKLVVTRP